MVFERVVTNYISISPLPFASTPANRPGQAKQRGLKVKVGTCVPAFPHFLHILDQLARRLADVHLSYFGTMIKHPHKGGPGYRDFSPINRGAADTFARPYFVAAPSAPA